MGKRDSNPCGSPLGYCTLSSHSYFAQLVYYPLFISLKMFIHKGKIIIYLLWWWSCVHNQRLIAIHSKRIKSKTYVSMLVFCKFSNNKIFSVLHWYISYVKRLNLIMRFLFHFTYMQLLCQTIPNFLRS